ncbi:MAG: DUF835 domain-containing protein [Candidatus Thermoplasmatota archaeon]|nr:DUF835 domain-containing protein [Candidatus Thermoplasmatota archaeon]
MEDLVVGKLYSLRYESQDKFLAIVDKFSQDSDKHAMLVSRSPQRRLLEHIDLDKVESYWMTTYDVLGAIQPSLEALEDLITSRVSNHEGVIFIEGVERLVALNGFSELMTMVMKIKDILHRRQWIVVFTINEEVFDEIQLAKWHKEVDPWTIVEKQALTNIDIDITEVLAEESDNSVIQEHELAGNKLSFLTKIPKDGYTKDILRKRILQWRRMGLDVSAAEPALYSTSDDDGYLIYKRVEENVRRAVELDNRLDLLEQRGIKSEVTKMRFRIRQLTGFDAVEKRIDELI